MHPLKPKPYKNKSYLNWLHSQGFTCMICDNPQIEIHHLQHGNRGRADNQAVTLCIMHHRIGKYSAHGFDKKLFDADNLDNMEREADRLFQQFKGEESE